MIRFFILVIGMSFAFLHNKAIDDKLSQNYLVYRKNKAAAAYKIRNLQNKG